MQQVRAVVGFSDREVGAMGPGQEREVTDAQAKRLEAASQVEIVGKVAKQRKPPGAKPRPSAGTRPAGRAPGRKAEGEGSAGKGDVAGDGRAAGAPTQDRVAPAAEKGGGAGV